MHKTKGARFAAHKRLEIKNYYNAFTISILSFYVICISFGLVVFRNDIDIYLANWLTFISVSLSVFIIIKTLMDNSERLDVKSEAMHNCAREVLDLYNKLKYEENPDANSTEEYRRKYNEILNKYPYNHDGIDREIYKSDSPHESETTIGRPKFKYFLNTTASSLVYLAFPIILICAIFYLNFDQFKESKPAEIVHTDVGN